MLFRWAQQAGAKDEEAGDLVQDVFLILLQSLPTFQYNPSGRFRNYLRTIAINKFRERKRRDVKWGPVLLDANSEPAVSDPMQAFWETEYRNDLTRRALELLKTDFNSTTWKACWEFVAKGRPALEVARELGITENAVYLAKCRVLRRLREELGGLLD